MNIFCLLWIPLFYLFRRSFVEEASGSGGAIALVLGSVTALVQFFLGNLIEPGGFGFSRWLSAGVDIVALPVLLPLLVYFVFIFLRIISRPFNFTNFALLWIMPGAAIRSLSWGTVNDPGLLILVPLLWAAIAVGIPFLMDCIKKNFRLSARILCGIGVAALPLSAVTSWWAVYSHNFIMGFGLLAVTLIPLAVSLINVRLYAGQTEPGVGG